GGGCGGATGDFFTSVDAGPWFGRLLAAQIGAWVRGMDAAKAGAGRWDLVEAGAGDGRLSRDLLDALLASAPDLYDRVAVHLVEQSEVARAEHRSILSGHASRLASSTRALPPAMSGVVVANELLDAFPIHLVIGTPQGLREIYVDATRDGCLVERIGPLSTPALSAYLDALGIVVSRNQRAEINLQALAWIRDLARRLSGGYLVLIDYGHEAADLYSTERPAGTLTSFRRHMADPPSPGTPPWLADPGQRDLTAHIDLTSIRREAQAAGLHTVTVTDQTRFLLSIAERADVLASLASSANLHDRLMLKSLLVPGGIGTTHKVMVFSRDGDRGPGTGDPRCCPGAVESDL
ncbi:MAG: SAM-dependent methyltransferase, partial [Acidobacteriota bacterium]